MKKNNRSKVLLFLAGGIVFLIFIFPLYWMLVTALKTQVEIFSIPTPLWPENLTFDAFAKQLSASGDTLRALSYPAGQPSSQRSWQYRHPTVWPGSGLARVKHWYFFS